jgi:uncharacterized membrane protein YecN with MAPEG domain
MVFPVVTATAAAVLGLIFAVLSGWVIGGRFSFGVLHGDGGQDAMQRRMRSHANFIEYVPLILLLDGLLEAGGSSRTLVGVLLAILAVARLMHPIGMLAPVNSMTQYVFRGAPAVATLVVLVISSLALLVRCLA